LDSGMEGIWWVGMSSGIEGDGWAASGGRSWGGGEGKLEDALRLAQNKT
jgi:hypothetical protein